MGINIGAFLATLLCGYLGETWGWRYGFGVAGVGMFIGLVIFLYGQRHLQGLAEPGDPALLKQFILPGLNRELLIYLGGLLSILGIWQLVQAPHMVELSLNGLALVVALGLLWFILARCNSVERGRMSVLMALTFSTVVFWALFEH